MEGAVTRLLLSSYPSWRGRESLNWLNGRNTRTNEKDTRYKDQRKRKNMECMVTDYDICEEECRQLRTRKQKRVIKTRRAKLLSRPTLVHLQLERNRDRDRDRDRL